MSIGDDKPGGKAEAEALVAEGKAAFDAARQAIVTPEQLSLLGTPSPEEMEAARERLGPRAGTLTVINEARRGRKPGSKNRRTEYFRRYALQFGQHPAITMMQIQNTPPEVLVERSKAIDNPKRQLSYGDAQQLRLRAAEGLMPYMESKMPVAIELTTDGDFNLLIPGLNITPEDAAQAAAGEFVVDAEFNEVDEPE